MFVSGGEESWHIGGVVEVGSEGGGGGVGGRLDEAGRRGRGRELDGGPLFVNK